MNRSTNSAHSLACSPDLTPTQFMCEMYRADLEEFSHRVFDDCRTITSDMKTACSRELFRRLEACLEFGGVW